MAASGDGAGRPGPCSAPPRWDRGRQERSRRFWARNGGGAYRRGHSLDQWIRGHRRLLIGRAWGHKFQGSEAGRPEDTPQPPVCVPTDPTLHIYAAEQSCPGGKGRFSLSPSRCGWDTAGVVGECASLVWAPAFRAPVLLRDAPVQSGGWKMLEFAFRAPLQRGRPRNQQTSPQEARGFLAPAPASSHPRCPVSKSSLA